MAQEIKNAPVPLRAQPRPAEPAPSPDVAARLQQLDASIAQLENLWGSARTPDQQAALDTLKSARADAAAAPKPAPPPAARAPAAAPAPRQQVQRELDAAAAALASAKGNASPATRAAATAALSRAMASAPDLLALPKYAEVRALQSSAPAAEASTVASRPPEKANAKYDYVVVGSGPGGGPLAARLGEAGYKVLVLEGGVDKDSALSAPLALHARASEDPNLLYKGKGYFIHHHDNLADDKKDSKFVDAEGGIFVPRGTGVGGSARMNAGIFVRPEDVDWDAIAKATGDTSWKSPEMLKYFQKVENAEYQPVLKTLHQLGKLAHIHSLQNIGGHGFDGWLEVNRPFDSDIAKMLHENPDLERIIKETVKYNKDNVGSPLDKIKMVASGLDPNMNMTNGVAGMVGTPLTVTKDGRRNTARDRLLDAAAKHPDNITVMTGAMVEDFVLNKENEATAVRYRTPDGKLHAEPFRRELVISAGAFETPAILMRSGVAPESERETLEKNGIDLKVVSEGVGNHLKGRYEIGVVTRLKKPLPVLTQTDFNADPDNPAYKKWLETGKGLFATNGIVAAFRVKSDPSKSEPDLYVFGVPGKFEGYKPGYSTEASEDPNLVTWVILDENKGKEKGTVKLDPKDLHKVLVNQKFFDDDKKGGEVPLVNGIKIVRDLVKRYGDIVDKEEWPGDAVKSDAELAKMVKENAWDHHPNGTAQLGSETDPQSVVNSHLQVIGVKGVRISDAAVFRTNMGSFIQSSIMTVSEKAAADLIDTAQKEDAALGHASPKNPLMSKPMSGSNTLSDNLFLAMHDTRKVGQDGVMTEAALKELVQLTSQNGFSREELNEARATAAALNQAGNPNARVLDKLVAAIERGRADQGFVDDLKARLDDVRKKSTLPSLAWADKEPAAADLARWKKEITGVQETIKNGQAQLDHLDRGFHQKQLFGGVAKVRVRSDVPDFLRFGPFEKPDADLKAALRFSNGQGCPMMDKSPDVRGAALKLFDDQGKPWDVLMTNQKTSHARDAEQFMKFAQFSAVSQAKGNPAGAAFAAEELIKGDFDKGEAARIAGQLAHDTVLHKVESLTTETFNGGTFRSPQGYLCKVVLMPADGAKPNSVDKRDPDWMSKELQSHLDHGPVRMVLGVQVYTGDGKTPDPTDATQAWSGPVYPVADVEIPAPGLKGEDVSKLVNRMAFNPANGFEPTHMTRARKEIYAQSAQNRGAISPDDARAALKKLGVDLP